MNVLRFSPRRACIGAALFSLSTLAFGVGKTYAQAAVTQAPNIVRPEVDIAFNQLLDAPLVKQAFQALEADHARAVQDMRDLTEIEAPPFGERKKAEEFLARLRAIGLANAQIDREGNVVAVRKGTSNGPTLLVSAHLDTVFPRGTDVRVKEREGRLYAPGISDDTRGLAVLLSWLRALNEAHVEAVGDLLVVADVGEEGLGKWR